ncbi:MAG: lysophospholipid acyltransferase family protein [Candidatus Acidiferrales bacterium]
MRQAYLATRSALLWTASVIHFFVICPLLVLLGIVVDPRKNDRPQRIFFRNIVRVAGARLEVKRAAGFDAQRTSIFICNHVNLFDPFVIYSAIPQFVRGFELESHFRIPAYGWMMGRFGNIPVPDKPSHEGLERMMRLAKAALDSRVSLIAFAEGGRTRSGHVERFHAGVFRIAVRCGVPVVPMSIVGSYEFFQTGHWMLHPARITVFLHDTIETNGMTLRDVDALRDRVHAMVSAPVEEAMKKNASGAK